MTELVKWIGKDGGHKVGTVAIASGKHVLSIGDGISVDVLIRYSHTGELEWVPESLLSRYEGEGK